MRPTKLHGLIPVAGSLLAVLASGCGSDPASQSIAAQQAQAVANLGPAADPATADAAALTAFGQSMHTVQDVYAHSNWDASRVVPTVDHNARHLG